jgi:hypothetical protein
MITLPLTESVRELIPGDASYPIKRGVFSNLMNKEEREHRDTTNPRTDIR